MDPIYMKKLAERIEMIAIRKRLAKLFPQAYRDIAP